jgi:hypothetical protein
MSSFQRNIPSFTSNTSLSVSADNSQHSSSQHSTMPSTLNTIQPNPQTELPFFLVIADSHGKILDPEIITPQFTIITKATPGLQWYQSYQRQLCATSLVNSPSISNLVSTCSGVLFLIGTNSVRSIPAFRIIEQVEHLIGLLRTSHPHLTGKHDISIVCAFPCHKPSFHFQSIESLTLNINTYNSLLGELSIRLKFSTLDLELTAANLHHDGMHLRTSLRPLVDTVVKAHFVTGLEKRRNLIQSRPRSRAALTRRNNKRHKRSEQKRKAYTVTRLIDRSWKLQHIKNFLKQRDIRYSRLPEIYNHQLRIFFTTSFAQQHADQTLGPEDFNERSYHDWLSQQQL